MKRAIDAGMPRTTRVMGQRYKVRTVENLRVPVEQLNASSIDAEFVHDEMMDVLGACDRDRLVIDLESDTGHDKFRETFVHEHLHALIGKTAMNHDVLHDAEEQVVNRLAPVLLQFLRDNPKAVEFLTDRRLLGAGSARWY